jgi:hypothetical protein
MQAPADAQALLLLIVWLICQTSHAESRHAFAFAQHRTTLLLS